jgi:hypothetical protein
VLEREIARMPARRQPAQEDPEVHPARPVVFDTQVTRVSVRSRIPFSGFSITYVTTLMKRPTESSMCPSHVVRRSRPRTRPTRSGTGSIPQMIPEYTATPSL